VLQEACPDIAFQFHVGLAADVGPQTSHLFTGYEPRQAPTAELAADGVGIWRQVGGDGDGGAEPGEEVVRVISGWSVRCEAAQASSTKFVGDERRAIRCDAHEPLAGLTLAVSEVAGKLLFSSLRLTGKMGLELEYSAPQQRVAASVDFGERTLKVDLGALGAQALDEEAIDESVDLGMSRPR